MLVAVVVILALVYYLTNPGGIEAMVGSVSWPSGDAAWEVAHAIAIAEGFNVSGSVPARLHNPGDISDGAVTFGSQPHSGSNVTTFPDDITGWNWLHNKISNIANGSSDVYSPDDTWEQIAEKWAGNSAPWLSIVTTKLGVQPEDRFGDYFGV